MELFIKHCIYKIYKCQKYKYNLSMIFYVIYRKSIDTGIEMKATRRHEFV